MYAKYKSGLKPARKAGTRTDQQRVKLEAGPKARKARGKTKKEKEPKIPKTHLDPLKDPANAGSPPRWTALAGGNP